MSTYIPSGKDIERAWFVIDAKNKVLGKIATEAASILQGKRKPIYTPFLDMGDHVIVINARRVHLTGKKESDKLYHHPTGYLGNLKTATAAEMRKKHPRRIIEFAIRGMLPKTKLGRAMYRKLRVYADAGHPHKAQNPQPTSVE